MLNRQIDAAMPWTDVTRRFLLELARLTPKRLLLFMWLCALVASALAKFQPTAGLGVARCLVVINFSPNVHHDYRVRVPFAGKWREVFNSDSTHYGGSNVGNVGEVRTLEGLVPALNLTIPPLAAIFLVPES